MGKRVPTVGVKVDVDSSFIERIGYDRHTQALTVQIDGQDKVFAGVPAQVHSDFVSAPSKGEFFNANIKGKYSYFRVAV